MRLKFRINQLLTESRCKIPSSNATGTLGNYLCKLSSATGDRLINMILMSVNLTRKHSARFSGFSIYSIV